MNIQILVLGGNGQVGQELVTNLQPIGNVISASRNSKQHHVDLSQPDTIRNIIRNIKPSLIINAAAYTAVDKAEEQPDLAMQINSEAPGIIAEEAKALSAKLIHYSTDYIFDGSKKTPYKEDDLPNPINIYGKSKLGGENSIIASGCDYIIFRTSWVYSSHGHNFLKTVLRLSNERPELNIVNDQIGCPNSAYFIATSTKTVLKKYIDSNYDQKDYLRGIYNLSTSTSMSWYEFAKYINEIGYKTKRCKKIIINPISSDEYPTLAGRPKNSVLSNALLFEKFNIVELPFVTYMKNSIKEL